MARRKPKLTLITDPVCLGSADVDSRCNVLALDVMESLRIATRAVLSHLESMAKCQTGNFHLAVRELKTRQRRLRIARRCREAQAG